MPHALDVARRLIQLSYRHDSPEESDLLCPLRLQKLLYYVQGWSLALRGRPAFDEPIEAWTLGPVVRTVYDAFKPMCAQVIVPAVAGEPSGLSASDEQLIQTVWREYQKFSASELIRRIHNERPWKDARGNLAAGAKSNAVISREALTAFFAGETNRFLKPGTPDPREAWTALEEYEETGGISADELFGELLTESRG
jgi:uncharacterized phage-associated protein